MKERVDLKDFVDLKDPVDLKDLVDLKELVDVKDFDDDLLDLVVKLGSRSKVYLKSLIRDLDLELGAIIACIHHHHHKTFLNRITLKSLLV